MRPSDTGAGDLACEAGEDTPMTTRTLRLSALAASTLLLLLFAVSARAGIEPVPWKTVITNHSDRLAPTSPLYGKAIEDLVLQLQVQLPTGAEPMVWTIPLTNDLGGVASIGSGQAFVASFDPSALPAVVSILSWRITAKMGIEPSPFRVYALDSRAATIADPGDAPWLPAALLSEQMSLYAFASPGTLIGSATMATDLFYDACPLTGAWKNHGQYVRCVALHAEELLSLGQISQEAADAAVSAAARSTVGK